MCETLGYTLPTHTTSEPAPHHRHSSAPGVILSVYQPELSLRLTCRTRGGGGGDHPPHLTSTPSPLPPPQWWQLRSHRKTEKLEAGHQTTLQSRNLLTCSGCVPLLFVTHVFNAPTHACSQSPLISGPGETQKPVGLLSPRPCA